MRSREEAKVLVARATAEMGWTKVEIRLLPALGRPSSSVRRCLIPSGNGRRFRVTASRPRLTVFVSRIRALAGSFSSSA